MKFGKAMRTLVLTIGLFWVHSATAGIMTVEVTSSGAGYSAGSWDIAGPTTASGSWDHFGLGSITESWDVDLLDGDYYWSIESKAYGFGWVGWKLLLDGTQVYANDKHVMLHAKIRDGKHFEVVAVPEPGTIGLLALGLIGLGLARRASKA